jgi:5'-3' exonuclease
VAAHTVHLIDASPYLFRAFFSVPASVVDRSGRPANAVHGFASFLLRYLREERPTHVGAAFDQSLTTSFRNELYPGYKAGRELPPPDLEAQQRDCLEMARALGLVTWVDPRYEADDLIAAACASLRRGGHRVVVARSDKDLGQLVEDEVQLFDFARGLRYGPDEIVERLGVLPAQVPDLLGLAGDPVDDIPGVPGIGRKTAERVIVELRERIAGELASQPAAVPSQASARVLAREGLVGLGYEPSEAESMLDEAAEAAGEDPQPEDLIAAALRTAVKAA